MTIHYDIFSIKALSRNVGGTGSPEPINLTDRPNSAEASMVIGGKAPPVMPRDIRRDVPEPLRAPLHESWTVDGPSVATA